MVVFLVDDPTVLPQSPRTGWDFPVPALSQPHVVACCTDPLNPLLACGSSSVQVQRTRIVIFNETRIIFRRSPGGLLAARDKRREMRQKLGRGPPPGVHAPQPVQALSAA